MTQVFNKIVYTDKQYIYIIYIVKCIAFHDITNEKCRLQHSQTPIWLEVCTDVILGKCSTLCKQWLFKGEGITGFLFPFSSFLFHDFHKHWLAIICQTLLYIPNFLQLNMYYFVVKVKFCKSPSSKPDLLFQILRILRRSQRVCNEMHIESTYSI